MKNSNVRWIGEIPNDWMITKLGSHFKCRNVKVDDISYPPLSVTKMGILPQMDTVAKSDANDNRKQVLSGDFVINSRSDRKQSCGVSKLTGSVSLINTILYQPNQDYDNGYVSFLLKNYGFAEEFYRWGHGIVADLWTTRWQEMKDIDLPFPPANVQKKIAYELQNKIKNIDSLVLNETKQIEKLKEYRQAIITKAVTKGLDSNAPMKDSGVEWIEKIPETWKVYPLKSMFSFGKGLPITKENLISTGEKVISYGQLHAKYNISISLVPEMFRYVSNSYLQSNPECIVHKGDFIMADTSEDREGTCDFVHINSSDLIFAGYHSIILRANNPLYSEYFAYLFLSDYWRDQFRRKVGGVKLFSLTKKMLSTGSVILPPEEDLYKIVTYLNSIMLPISQVIDKKTSQIRCLEDYKESLIYEYVTGKKRVSL